ncbi:MAG: DMT family transporter [Pseudomonadota bacterium]
MTTERDEAHRANIRGSAWMVAAMGAFAIEDVLIKAASASLPLGELLILFGFGGAIVFACVAAVRGDRLFSADAFSRSMQWRFLFEVSGRLFYALAITLSSLSVATVILQATPIVVIAGAALLFGEHVDWRRWFAVFLGMAGVVVIIQPGTEGFSELSLLALFGMVGFAGRDLASRAAPVSVSTSALGFFGFLSVIVAGSAYSLYDGEAFLLPEPSAVAILLGAMLVGASAYACLMKAMRTGSVSAVTTFRYSRLLFGVALGVLLFDEALSLSVMVGCAMIACAGLITVRTGNQQD